MNVVICPQASDNIVPVCHNLNANKTAEIAHYKGDVTAFTGFQTFHKLIAH